MPGAGRTLGYIDDRKLKMNQGSMYSYDSASLRGGSGFRSSSMGIYDAAPGVLERQFAKMHLHKGGAPSSMGGYSRDSTFERPSYRSPMSTSFYMDDNFRNFSDQMTDRLFGYGDGPSHNYGGHTGQPQSGFNSNYNSYRNTSYDHPQHYMGKNRYELGLPGSYNKRPLYQSKGSSWQSSAPGYQKTNHKTNYQMGSSLMGMGHPRRQQNFGYGNVANNNYRNNNMSFIKPRRPRLVTSTSKFSSRPRFIKKGYKKLPTKPTKKDGSKTEEEGEEGNTEGKEVEEEEAAPGPFPVEALYCHMCDIGKFASKNAYYVHLRSDAHNRTAEVFHAKSAAQLEYLQQASKLSTLRLTTKAKHNATGKIEGRLPKTVEQTIFQRFRKIGSCCGELFESHYSREEHKVTGRHLREVYDKSQTRKLSRHTPPLSTGKKMTEPEVEELIQEAQKQEEEDPVKIYNLPPYDCNVLFGLQFFSKTNRFFCTPCNATCAASNLAYHAQSERHYNKIIEHYERVKQKEKEAAAKERALKEKETADEGDATETTTTTTLPLTNGDIPKDGSWAANNQNSDSDDDLLQDAIESRFEN